MSKLVIGEKDSKGNQIGIIEGVSFAYVKLQDGAYKYNSKTEKEYVVDCIVDKATAKAFKKAFPKNSCKEIDTVDFESKYKFEAPYDGDEQYVVKLKADANLKAPVSYSVDGEQVTLQEGDTIPYEWTSRPKVYLPEEGGVKDATMTTLVANGSKGVVSFKIRTNDYGTFPQLIGIRVDDLVEYEGGGGNVSPFGEIIGGLNKPTEPKQKATSTKEPEVHEEDDSDDDPFAV